MNKQIKQLIIEITNLVMTINTETKADVSVDYFSHVKSFEVIYYPRGYKVDQHLFKLPQAYLDWDDAIEKLELIKEELGKLFKRLSDIKK